MTKVYDSIGNSGNIPAPGTGASGIFLVNWTVPGSCPMRKDTLHLAALAALGLAACTTPQKALRFADCEAEVAIAAKQRCVYGHEVPYAVCPPRDRIRDQTLDELTGLATRPTPLEVGTKSALGIAAYNSREYQRQKEILYRSALALVNEKIAFRPSPFLRLSGDAERDGDVTTLGASGELGVTKMLRRGGTVAISAGGDFLRFVSNPTSENATTFINVLVDLPLLRGAGEDVVLENLRQADRDVLYAVRDLERFKQTFSVQIETQYFRVVAAAVRVKNEERNLVSVTEALRRNIAFAEAQRITEIEVDQARQDELRARNRLVLQRNNFQNSLDAFKNTLGIPVDLGLMLDEKELDTLVKLIDTPFTVEERTAIERAVQLRLDLQNVRDQIQDAKRRIRVAENQLKPDLAFVFDARPDSDNLRPFKVRFEEGRYTAALDADLGLDRRNESVSLRQAHLDLSMAIRDFEGAIEEVKIEIRDALRTLEAARETYKIQERAVAVAKRRVESVNEFMLRGDASTRDLLEAQEALVNSENDLVNALVEFRVTYLNFYRDAGALVVSPEGLDHETSDALLATS
jgi:outer membrane protein TolC